MKTTTATYRKNPRFAAIVSAAMISAMALLATGSARAQTQVGANGRLNDSNNRIGSGGTNSYHEAPSVGILGNNIVTGAVSGGREFHGSIGYSDPTTFRGLTGGSSTTNFIGASAGIGLSNQPPPIPNSFTSFYGESRYAAPAAPGFSKAPTGSAYIPAKPGSVEAGDLRLGARLEVQPNSTPAVGHPSTPQSRCFHDPPTVG